MTDESRFESSVLAELDWRGLIKQHTHDELDQALDEGRLTLYCGFDPSADSLHAGNLIAIIGLAHFRRHGHDPVALVGGATGMIGDPSGKDDERELLTEERIERNLAGIREQLRTILDRSLTLHAEDLELREGAAEIPIVNNADWMKPWSFLEFLRDVGKNFRVNHMIAKESVKNRLENREQGISYTEFSYMLIQAYDFLHLFEERGCTLQIGGSDQWGNITAGTDLIKRKCGESAFGLTIPLLTDSEGKKYGKTAEGAIWLDAERTSPYKFYQYWRNLEDREMPQLLRTFTFLPRARVDELVGLIERQENRGEVQRELAYEITRLVHGDEEADNAVKGSKALFGGGIAGLDERTLRDVFDEVPSTEIERGRLADGVGVLDLFVETGLQKSKGAARRLLKQGGLYLNDERVEDQSHEVSLDDLLTSTMLVLRSGKKKYHVVRVV